MNNKLLDTLLARRKATALNFTQPILGIVPEGNARNLDCDCLSPFNCIFW